MVATLRIFATSRDYCTNNNNNKAENNICHRLFKSRVKQLNTLLLLRLECKNNAFNILLRAFILKCLTDFLLRK